MEQNITWKSPGKIVFFLVSLLLLGVLLLVATLVDPVVRFSDPNLEKVIREKIHQPSAPISRLDVLAITKLDASGQGIRRLDGIEALRRLAVLNLAGNFVEDLSPLANLGMLSELNLQDNQITDLEAVNFRRITHLPLRSLSLRNNVAGGKNRLSDISLLSELTQIQILDLRDNYIQDIEPLSHLNSLQNLNLRGNRIRDLGPLASLAGLVSLNIHTNPVESGLDALSRLENLQTLIMRNVLIGENYHFLRRLTKLQRLNIRNSGIADVSVIGDLMQAGALQDHIDKSIHASIDLQEIDPSGGNEKDPYLSLRRYWDNISYPYPINLPYESSAVKLPVFSRQSGFYDDGFYLTISAQESGETVYYTLDGAEPSFTPTMEMMGSTRAYTGSIFIQSRVGQPNQLSSIVTDKWKQYVPATEVFKGTEVRAIVIDGAGNRSHVVTQTYFVEPGMKKRYTFPVVSIVTNPRNLFDDQIGVYALGNFYQNVYPDEPWRNPANFMQRGLKWERPASFEMFSPEGKTLVSQNIGIRIHGGFSRGFSPKSLRLYARDEYDQQSLFRYNFFPKLNDRLNDGTVDSYQTLILRSAGNDVGTLFRDTLAQSLLEHTRLDLQGSQPVIVFINGEYWGIHNIRTRYDEHYFQTHYGISPDQLLVLDRGDDIVRLGNYTDQGNNFSNLFALIDTNSQNAPSTARKRLGDKIYQEIAARVDIDNFISYYASEIYFDNTDWPKSNMLTWTKTTGLNADPNFRYGHDGKLRWMVMDIDSGIIYPEHNNLERLLVELRNEPSTRILVSLLENEGFRHRFITQFADHLNTTFREEVVVSKIHEFETLYSPEIEDHTRRWGVPKSLNAWLKNVDIIRKFALSRPTHQRQHIVKYFNLPGTATVNLVADSSQGYIRINTIDIQKGTVGVDRPNNWSGIYFQGVPVKITAVPLEGYHFVRWEGQGKINSDPASPTLSIVLKDDLRLVAIFAADEAK